MHCRLSAWVSLFGSISDLNFYFFSQPLVSNSFSFLWTIYITYMASLKKADVEVATST